MRVAVVLTQPPLPEGGAPGKCAVALLRGLRAHGLDVYAIAARRAFTIPGDPPPDLPVEVIDVAPGPGGWRSRIERLERPLGELASGDFAARVREVAEDADILHLEETETAWCDFGISTPSLVHLHYLMHLDRPYGWPTPWRRDYRYMIQCRLAEEAAVWRHRHVVASSPVVAEALRRSLPARDVVLAPLALDPADYEPAPLDGPPTAGIIGSAAWPPTAAATVRLIRDVWPRVRERAPEARLLVAGRGMEEVVATDRAAGIEVRGEVESARSFFHELSTLVYPLERGSGMKVKVLEAIASGVPVVTTASGAEGIHAGDGVVVEATNDAIADAAAEILRDEGERRERGDAARAAFEERYSPRPATEPLVGLYEQLAGPDRRAPGAGGWPRPRRERGEQQPRELSGASAVAGGLWITVSGLLPQLYTLVGSVVAARVLGPADLGRLSFIAFVELSVALLLASGMAVATARAVGDALGRGRLGEARAIAGLAFRVEVVAAAVAFVAVALIGVARGELQTAWLLAAVSAGFSVLSTTAVNVLTGLHRWRKATVVGIVTGAAGMVAGIAVLVAGGGITGLFAVTATVAAANFLGNGLLARAELLRASTVVTRPTQTRSQLLRYAGLATLDTLLTLIVWRRSEFFFLDQFSSNSQLAFYSVAFGLTAALTGINAAVLAVSSPAAAALAGAATTDRLRSWYGRGMRLLVLLGLTLTAAAVALGPSFVETLYGDAFEHAGTLFVLLIAPFPLIVIMSLSAGFLTGLGRLRLALAATAGAAVLNLTLDIALIPRYDATGAAVANTISQVAAAAAVAFLAWRILRPFPLMPGVVARAAVASAVAGAAAWLVAATLSAPLALAVGLPVFVATLLLVGAALRVMAREDALWLADAAERRGIGGVGPVFRLLGARA